MNGSKEVFRSLLITYLKNGGTIFAGNAPKIYCIHFGNRCPLQTLIDFDWIPDLLFRSSELWTANDLSSLDICLIGTLASEDTVFQNRLNRYLINSRSPCFSNRAPDVDSLSQFLFSANSIINHFHKLQESDRQSFLVSLSKKGSAQMMKLFIDTGININEGNYRYLNLLRIVAVAGNTDVVHVLLDAGANATSALAYFLSKDLEVSKAIWEQTFRLLIDSAQPALSEGHWDPLLKMIFRGEGYRNPMPTPYLEIIETLLARNLFL